MKLFHKLQFAFTLLVGYMIIVSCSNNEPALWDYVFIFWGIIFFYTLNDVLQDTFKKKK